MVSVAIYDHVEALNTPGALAVGRHAGLQLRGAARALRPAARPRRRRWAEGRCSAGGQAPQATANRRRCGLRLPAAGIEARFAVDYAGFRLDVDLRLPGRGVTALFGHLARARPRCCAASPIGLAARGRLVVNGECWQDDARRILVPTHRRALGYVFQEASLFPTCRCGATWSSA